MTTVGEILKKERHDKGLLLSDIEKKIKVREKYLKALEENNWNFFSSKIYIIGILKNYSKLLGLDQKKIVAFFRRDYEKNEEVKFKKKVSSSYLTSETKKAIRLVLVFSFLVIFAYFGYQLSLYFSPPSFQILSPTTNTFYVEDRIRIVGKTNKDTVVTVFGQRLYLGEDGTFSYDFPLHEGINKIDFLLTGANGKSATIEKIFYKKTPQ